MGTLCRRKTWPRTEDPVPGWQRRLVAQAAAAAEAVTGSLSRRPCQAGQGLTGIAHNMSDSAGGADQPLAGATDARAVPPVRPPCPSGRTPCSVHSRPRPPGRCCPTTRQQTATRTVAAARTRARRQLEAAQQAMRAMQPPLRQACRGFTQAMLATSASGLCPGKQSSS